MGASTDTNLLHVAQARYVSFSANTKLVVSAAWDDDVLRVWKTDTGELLQTFVAPNIDEHLPSLSANGERLICRSPVGFVVVWDVATGDRLQIIESFLNYFESAIAIASDGKTVASADYDQIQFWDVSSGNLLSKIKTRWKGIQCLRFSPDDAYIAVGSHTACEIFNIRTQSSMTYLEGFVACLAISPDNLWIATTENYEGNDVKGGVQLWETATGKRKGIIQPAKPIRQMAFSDDGTCLYTNQGRFPIDSILKNNYAGSGQVGEGIHYRDGWVHDGEQKIILLPPEWGPDVNYAHLEEVSPSKDGILAFGNRSGGVVVIEFGEGVIGSLE